MGQGTAGKQSIRQHRNNLPKRNLAKHNLLNRGSRTRWLLLVLMVPLLVACNGGSQAGERPAMVAEQSPAQSSGQSSGQSGAGASDLATAPLAPEVPPAPIAPAAKTPETMALAATTADADLLSPVPQGEHQGPFRVGNQTPHPLRIAFLQRSPAEASAATGETPTAETAPDTVTETATETTPPSKSLDLEPIHWDFAPGEGGQSGLLLSVPQGDVELRDGDVLVAFAQDGSRRYWGPYVVGQTQLPYWNGERSEWQLLIQP